MVLFLFFVLIVKDMKQHLPRLPPLLKNVAKPGLDNIFILSLKRILVTILDTD